MNKNFTELIKSIISFKYGTKVIILEKSKDQSVSGIGKLSIQALSLYALGLDWNKLSIVPYSPLWPIIYEAESKRILHNISPWLERLEHVGSTAVANLSAKPIIDIIGAVSSIESIDSQILNFYKLGYNYLGECGRPGRYFFTFNRAATTFFHLHLVNRESSYWYELVSGIISLLIKYERYKNEKRE